MRRGTLIAVAVAALVAAAPAASAEPAWHTAWSRSQAVAPSAPPLAGQTVRVITRVTAGGTQVRVRLQNAFGKSVSPESTPPLTVDAASVAERARGASLVPGTLRPLRFGGSPSVTIPAGGWVDSDPVALDVQARDDLAVSAHTPLAAPPAHFIDTVTNYVSGFGDATGDLTGAAYTQATTTTPLVAGVDVAGSPLAGTVVAIGGSVVDGVGSTLDGHDAWPDDLARRLDEVAPTRRKAVVNAGVASTTAARACANPLGPGVQDRLERDALSLAGVTDLIVYAGTNDLAGTAGVGRCDAAQVIAAMQDIVRQAHAAGVRVFITTITPRDSYDAAQDADRATVNAWIRAGGNCSGGCDRALDFDAAVRDPARQDRIDPALDSGDGIHPNPEGYARIAQSIDLADLGVAPVTSCRSRRTVRFTLPRGAGRVRVTVGGRRVRVQRSGRTVVLRLAGEQRPRVRVRLTASGGYRRSVLLHLCGAHR